MNFPLSRCGIYGLFLKESDEVVYIGKTTRSFEERWKEHETYTHNHSIMEALYRGDFEFREVESYPLGMVDNEGLEKRELQYIRLLQPSFNTVGRTSGFPRNIQNFKDKYDLILFRRKDFIAPYYNEDEDKHFWTYQVPRDSFSHGVLLPEPFYLEDFPFFQKEVRYEGVLLAMVCLIYGLGNFNFPVSYRNFILEQNFINFTRQEYNSDKIFLLDEARVGGINEKGEVIDLGVHKKIFQPMSEETKKQQFSF